MARSKTAQRSKSNATQVVQGRERPRRNYARWRAVSLSLVYVAFAIHIIHWKMSGKTLAPLELNEVMYTLELGIITAGFLFMSLLVLGTLFFGRFFCSWACHIMVLQDLCAWMLRKLGIRQKPIRSRLLLWVPPLTALYMFVWPQIRRAWLGMGIPEFHLRTDAEGWASLMTENFWRNLPSVPVVVLTFLVCGFAIVYLLGSRTFCTYVCPYGAVFALADRFALGRIRVNDACRQCGTCTAACTSGIRVHEEVKKHGMVVNPACMKDLDCVSACPQQALHYGFARPALLASDRDLGRFGLHYDFSLPEEFLAAGVCLGVTLTLRGLYSRIPFLLSIALGVIIAVVAVTSVRLLRRPNVKLATLSLRARGRVTRTGVGFLVVLGVLVPLMVHSAFIRYHEYVGLMQSSSMVDSEGAEAARQLAASAQVHLLCADRWGLLHNERVERSLVDVSFRLERHDIVEAYVQRILQRHPDDAIMHVQLARSWAAQGQGERAQRRLREVIERWIPARDSDNSTLVRAHQLLAQLFVRRGAYALAELELRAVITLDPARAGAHAELGSVLAETGAFDEAISSLREAVRIEPTLAQAQYNLGTILGHLGRFDEAVYHYQEALAVNPDDADLHNNLGYALLQVGTLGQARNHLEQALKLDANSAGANYNLGTLFELVGKRATAMGYFRRAATLDPRYSPLLDEG